MLLPLGALKIRHMCDPAAPLWLPWPAGANLCFENRPTGHRRTNTDNPAKWSQTCLLAERRSPGHRCSMSFSTHVYKLCISIGQCRTASQSTPAAPSTRRTQGAPSDAPTEKYQTQPIFVSRPRAAKCGWNLCAHVVPGRSRRAPPAATDRQRSRGSSCAAGFKAAAHEGPRLCYRSVAAGGARRQPQPTG